MEVKNPWWLQALCIIGMIGVIVILGANAYFYTTANCPVGTHYEAGECWKAVK